MNASISSELGNISSSFWIMVLLAVAIAAGTGFAAGIFYARWSDKRSFSRARAGVAQLFQTVISTIDTAQEVCRLLEKCPGTFLKPNQTEQLVQKRNGLLDAISSLVRRHDPNSDATPQRDVAPSPAPTPFKVEWTIEPTDPSTGLPGRQAFDENLALLMKAGQESERTSGLLLIKIDKFENLRSRLGVGDSDKLVKKMMAVVCRSVRDEDLVCRYSADMLAILLPDTDPETGRSVAGAARDSIRAHHFRVEEHGPEIFVTASFGYTACRPLDNPDLAVNRGADALSKSQQRGRNQLHAHDGQSIKHCLAG